MMALQIERLASLEQKVDNINRKLDDLVDGLDRRYASKTSERLVYGLVGLVLTAVLLGLLGLLGLSLHPSTITQTTTTPASTSTTTPESGGGSTTTTPGSSTTTTNNTTTTSPSGSVLDGLGRLLK